MTSGINTTNIPRLTMMEIRVVLCESGEAIEYRRKDKASAWLVVVRCTYRCSLMLRPDGDLTGRANYFCPARWITTWSIWAAVIHIGSERIGQEYQVETAAEGLLITQRDRNSRNGAILG